MPITSERYADWKAPRADEEILVWPSAAELLQQTAENQNSLSTSEVRIATEPLAALRTEMRNWIGHNDSAPLIATGHQTELYHPGVWAKNVLINRIAEKAGGAAYLFAVDTDEPKHLSLRWPGTSIEITDDPHLTTAAWSGLLEPSTAAHLDLVESKLETAAEGWSFRPVAGEFLRNLRRLLPDAERLSPTLVNALHSIDWSLGLRHHAMTVTPMFHARPYLMLVAHLMSRAGGFASDYNAALADYRREQSIRTPGRPMPDLKITPDHVESPFWLDALSTGSRQRATLENTAGGFRLTFANDPFIFEKGPQTAEKLLAWLRRHNLRLSPRALTLTLFLRLMLADQFVHGIGGGRYDQVADRLIARHFNLAPPHFSVTTATMYFQGAVGRSRVCLPCLLRDRHKLLHGALGSQKGGYVQNILSLPRRSIERRAAYHDMHTQLKQAGTTVMERFDQRLAEARARQSEESELFDRELPYLIQSQDRLARMIEMYQQGV